MEESKKLGDGKILSFYGVQVLRGLAASLVVILHATRVWSRTVSGSTMSFWGNGASGVDIFFIISGFVMAVSTIGREHKTHPAGSFLGRRFIRVIPLYWLMTLVVLAKMLVTQGMPQLANVPNHPHLSAGWILTSFSFIPYMNPEGQPMPLLEVGWTLCYEMFFYVLFSLALALRVRVARLLTPLMIALVVAGYFHQSNWPAFTILASPLLLEFLAGLLLGCAVLKGFRFNSKLAIAAGVLGLAALLCVPYADIPKWRMIVWAIPAFGVVFAAVALEDKLAKHWPRWMLIMGNASYSIYLSHIILFGFTVNLMIRFRLLRHGVIRGRDEVITVLILVPLAAAFGVLCYEYVEKPMNDLLRRKLLKAGKPQTEKLEYAK